MAEKLSFIDQISFYVTNYAKQLDIAILILSLLIWSLFWALFIHHEFGVVFFSLSLISFIFLSLGKKRFKKELSAYSVFNPDCRRLPGTLTGEHVDKGIRLQL
ncbi:hypothetical protein LOD99_3365 [Oopsacas minuta]|uniref:SAYSvFN domain-containing protein n=1 Tax=Oopsacas minuta TaxID=111878 RepID=A0AAV7JY27_9METZ|nr:hypothetical protein LOD99_3365 [Oopsacas minuta]